jgi:hypothetical protein
MSSPSASLQAFLRRGGVLSGQRLIFAVLAVILLLFYFSSSSASHHADASRLAPPKDPGRDIIADELRKDPEPPSLADQLFDYLGANRDRPSSSAAAPATTPSVAPYTNPEAAGDPVCELLAKGTKDLLVVVNTQAADLYQNLPSRVLTNLRCAPLELYSTVSHKIGSFVVHDALSDIARETREEHKEFTLYSKLQAAQRSLLDFSRLREDGDHNLEKWSVVPALVAAYRAHPDRKWFVLIRDDTYLSLPNLLAWLGQLDASAPLYAGTRVHNDGIDYASSAEGIVLSNAAAAALAALHADRPEVWERAAPQVCCGDMVLGAAMRAANVSMTPAQPHTQGESPMTVEWSPHGERWCKAALTWNRMTPQLMDSMWQFERNWTLSYHKAAAPAPTATSLTTTTTTATETESAAPVRPTGTSGPAWGASLDMPPILPRDVFEGLILPFLRVTSNLTDWDNGAATHELTDKSAASSFAHSSFDTCRAACDIRSKCVQYVHERNRCRMGTTVKIGEPKVDRERGALVSGWLAHRAKQLLVEAPACEDGAAFFVPVAPAKKEDVVPVAVGELRAE